MANIDLKPEIPDALYDLFSGKADFRGAYGGRGSGKTFSFAKVLAYYGAGARLRIVCAREIQMTISESVFFEIKSAIESCPTLTRLYDIGRTYIRGINGTEFIFRGLRHNIAEIKGLGQIDILWIDEAEAVSDESWRETIPTIRKNNSEIWATWNPKRPDAKVHQIFVDGVIAEPDDEEHSDDVSIVKSVMINWRDNPWFPKKLNRERLRNLRKDPLTYEHVWEGQFLILSQQLVYHYFTRTKHHSDRVITANDHYLHVGQDFNIGACCSTVFVIDSGYPVAVDEFISHDTRDLCIQLSSRYPGKHITIYPDASGQSRHTNASESDIDILRAAGFSVMVNGMNPAVRDRINAVNGLLAHDKLKVNTNTCPHLTNALESQGYNKNGQPEKFDEHPAIDDWNDSLGYFISYRWPVAGLGGISRLVGY